jgi:hypothetical protein
MMGELRELLYYWFGSAKCMGCSGRVRIVGGRREAAYCGPCIERKAWEESP